MSRIGKKPISIPSQVQVKVESGEVRVKGPLGELSYRVDNRFKVAIKEGQIFINREGDDRLTRSLHGLTRTNVFNLLAGVTDGYQKTVEMNGVGFRAQVQGRAIHLIVGFSHPVVFPLPKGIDAFVEKQTSITIKGIDKQLVGQVSANLRAIRPPEPYKGKGIKYSDEVIKRKEGKTGK